MIDFGHLFLRISGVTVLSVISVKTEITEFTEMIGVYESIENTICSVSQS